MKNLSLILTALLISNLGFGQDRIGMKFAAIMKSTKNISGLMVEASGDSLIKITDNQMERYFLYKFDAKHICYQEDVQMNVDDIQNVAAFNHFVQRTKITPIKVSEEVAVYNAKASNVMVTKRGNLMLFSFRSKMNLNDSPLNIKNQEQASQLPLISEK